MGSTTLISSAFTALLNCAEVGRRNRILTNYRFLSHSLFLMYVGEAKKAQTGAIGLQGDLDGTPLVSLCHLIGLFG